ncbi:MAG: CHAT domain-containing protein [Chloroflexi bacterium]|nr:CHAT domain-containing protein [Chloroflexota bacterium]
MGYTTEATDGRGSFAELLVRLSPGPEVQSGDARSYRVQAKFTRAGSGAPTDESGTASFDLKELAATANDQEAYARLLSQQFYADPAVRSAVDRAIALSARDADDVRLRVQLEIGPDVPELSALRWEMLRDPSGVPIATSDRILFSRYLPSAALRSLPARSVAEMRALVVIASPARIEQAKPEGVALERIDVKAELSRVAGSLQDMAVTALVSRGDGPLVPPEDVVFSRRSGVTLDNLVTELRRSPGYDIVYVVCHGAYSNGEARLYLENDGGEVTTIGGEDLVREVSQLGNVPRLVVLASCQSAGSGHAGALAALGQELIRAGVGAVVAMQDQIGLETAAALTTTFFEVLGETGNIELAMSRARHTIRDMRDAWVPVLFTRLETTELWTAPGAGGFDQWKALLAQIEDQECVPILGFGLSEFLLGSARQIAEQWAEEFDYPMSPNDRQNLAEVAQYLARNNRFPDFPARELRKYVERELQTRYREHFPDGLPQGDIDALISVVGKRHREEHPDDPYRVLAGLPFPVYVSASVDSLLVDALRDAGKDPTVELCRWNERAQWPPSVCGREARPVYKPTVERPLVFQVLGQIGRSKTMVLTEDDYFDYLIEVSKNQDLNPVQITERLSSNSVLFLGFLVTGWPFRVLFRSLVQQAGSSLGRDLPHVAVQIRPDEDSTLDPIRASQYLDRYFQSENISIYWGSSTDFVRNLRFLWRQLGHELQEPQAT